MELIVDLSEKDTKKFKKNIKDKVFFLSRFVGKYLKMLLKN